MTPKTLLSLADRVCAGDGPDRELDCCVEASIIEGASVVKFGDRFSVQQHGHRYYSEQIPAYTSSLDVVESLRARMLPISTIDVFHSCRHPESPKNPWYVTIDGTAKAQASSEPRARLAAILRALAAGG